MSHSKRTQLQLYKDIIDRANAEIENRKQIIFETRMKIYNLREEQ